MTGKGPINPQLTLLIQATKPDRQICRSDLVKKTVGRDRREHDKQQWGVHTRSLGYPLVNRMRGHVQDDHLAFMHQKRPKYLSLAVIERVYFVNSFLSLHLSAPLALQVSTLIFDQVSPEKTVVVGHMRHLTFFSGQPPPQKPKT